MAGSKEEGICWRRPGAWLRSPASRHPQIPACAGTAGVGHGAGERVGFAAFAVRAPYGDGSFVPLWPLPAVIRRLRAFMYAFALATIMSVSEPRPR